MTFGNAAVDAGIAKAPVRLPRRWATFDNVTREVRPIGESTIGFTQMTAPTGLPTADGSHVRVADRRDRRRPSSWSLPVHAYFRRTNAGWTLVGFERIPDAPGR